MGKKAKNLPIRPNLKEERNFGESVKSGRNKGQRCGRNYGRKIRERVKWEGINNKKSRLRVLKGMTRWMYEREKMGRGKIGKEEKIIMMEVAEAVRDITVSENLLVNVGGGVTIDGREWHRTAARNAIEAAIRAGYLINICGY